MARRKRYLVGVDFSAGSLRALEAARRLARETGASLTLAHVRPSSEVRAAIVEERGDLLQPRARSLRREIAEHYARRLGGLTRSADGETYVLLTGAPDIALCRELRRGYELLVMGSRGRGAASALFLGSTVQRALARSRVPVLVVPRSGR